MLGKLMKYELKATARWFLPLYAAALFMALLNRFLFLDPLINGSIFANGSFASLIQGIISTLSMLLYVILFVGIFVATLIVVIQRFYKSLLGDEGYLMFTLPVKTWQHILNKLIVSMLWYLASALVAFSSILILIPKDGFVQFSYFLKEIKDFFGVSGLIMLSLLVILALIISVMEMYLAIALGHLFNKHKLLLSFGMYLGIQTVFQFLYLLIILLSIKVISVSFTDITMNIPAQFRCFLGLIICVLTLFCVIHFILTNYLIKRKLNLE